MKNCIILSLLLSLVAMTCLAIPAKRVRKSLTLSDGTTVTATLVGDENGHWYVDDQGRTLSEDSTGIAHYMSIYELDYHKKAKTERAACAQTSLRLMRTAITLSPIICWTAAVMAATTSGLTSFAFAISNSPC